MKYLHLLVAVLFALFAYWQLNDPDWPLWVAMYGSVSVVGLWSFLARPPRVLIYLALGVAVIWMLTLVPDLFNWISDGMPTIAGQMKAESPHIELTREFFGLLITSVTLGLYVWRT
ncbi:transmembrane family 220 protein [Neolewinella xylanilytica]|uniref:Transmembrane family 220 protein n=1 Tax=Neolewinella xylanilytica TaxID=1514080 RepID=A0A2S6IBH9_9BACT|nr:transmembrane 220 family protein [Neolewinella xylanilytica]PPK88822.1 transmembrane family 220 protein [Neolewinella xylanilytica]